MLDHTCLCGQNMCDSHLVADLCQQPLPAGRLASARVNQPPQACRQAEVSGALAASMEAAHREQACQRAATLRLTQLR
jgi:hypothetical protein